MVDEPRPRIPISADWVRKRIQEGKNVRLKNAIIEGDLNLNELDLPTQHVERTEEQKLMSLKEDVIVVKSSIKIINSEIQGNLDFSNATFSGDAEFNGATFSGDAEFNGATFSGEAGFKGATFSREAGFNGATFSRDAGFNKATFRGDAGFNKATFRGDAGFKGATFSEYAWFNGATFRGDAGFNDATFRGDAWFNGATFSREAGFNKATFSRDAGFNKATFRGDAGFNKATFNRYAGFNKATFSGYAGFNKATFSRDAGFNGTKFEGDVLTFRDATFIHAKSQEEACRKAKNVLEKNGDREEAGYHFYREMEGKRKQKESDYGYFDYEALLFCKETGASPRELTDLFKYLRYNLLDYLFIQVIFGYGVHPRRLWGFWMSMVGILAIFYWIGCGVTDSKTDQPLTNFLEYLWFSITVAVTPGFAGYKPVPGFYQILAGGEAIFGTFMWAAFITTFAKKYMR